MDAPGFGLSLFWACSETELTPNGDATDAWVGCIAERPVTDVAEGTWGGCTVLTAVEVVAYSCPLWCNSLI